VSPAWSTRKRTTAALTGAAVLLWASLTAAGPPPEAPEALLPLLGSYGPDHALVEVAERDGALVLWPVAKPEAVEALPPSGDRRFGGVTFIGAPGGVPNALVRNGVLLARRDVSAETIASLRGWLAGADVPALSEAGRALTPPQPDGATGPVDLAEPAALDSTIRVSLKYATPDNFTGQVLYPPGSRLYLKRPAAEALVRVQARLQPQGYGLLLYDGYRPWYVTRVMWEAMPAQGRRYVANPARGSRHNRGAAIDLTLVDLRTGAVVAMPSGFDEFSHRSHADALSGTSRQRWHRALLRAAMEAEGFAVFADEWWHFDYQGWRQAPILNVDPTPDGVAR
jgi:D-alanyl-D-alanine dipeptidase